MRYLVLSDVHANLEALEAVLAWREEPYDATLVLGDLVGYGADPNAVVARLRALPSVTLLRGNHDKVAAGLAPMDDFNPMAREAIRWTAETLTPDHRAWLAALPTGPVIVDEDVEICHGTPFDEDVYLMTSSDAARSFAAMRRPLCLFGHTHVPAVFRALPRRAALRTPHWSPFDLPLDAGERYLVNVGAVGQPRDENPDAAFGLLDTAARWIRSLRVEYDVGAAQRKIRAAGLPELLALRLASGR